MPRLAGKTGPSVERPATAVKPRYLPIPSQDSLAAGRLILRDGTSATLRLARREDQEAMAAFFARLSPASRIRRFFSPTAPSREFIESFCDNSNAQAKASLIVLRTLNDGPRIVATGSYIAKDETTARSQSISRSSRCRLRRFQALSMIARRAAFARSSSSPRGSPRLAARDGQRS